VPIHGFLDGPAKPAEEEDMRIGYARVSTSDQNLDLQKDALQGAGCERIIVDKASGGTVKRAGLDRARDLLRRGDTLVIWRLDRLGRSLKHLIELMADLEQRQVGFQSLQESIDTTSPGGRLVFHIFGALAEFERNRIRERTKAGLEAARARGRKGGRTKALDAEQRALAVELYERRKHSVKEICRTLGISKPTLYAYVRERRS
jgi:DNA invertase Pin-like site-specific DNA recombinase